MTDLSLQQAAEDYLALRRSFGYRLQGHDGPLADFVHYLDRAGLDTVTVDSALAWAVEPVATPLRHAQRLSIARGFATYLRALDPRCEVPPRDLLPEGRRRVPPHIYTADEIAELITQSRGLWPPLRAATLETVIGLLAVTGMRSGEAVRLNRGDVDFDAGRLRIVATKFNKSRELALHPTTVEALERYASLRDRRWPQAVTAGFFVSSTGRRLAHSSLIGTFAELVRRAGLEPPPGSRARRPRLHDARHSFAVATLLRWHRTGEDVQALLPALSAQLGHVNPASTYWYLTAVPELLALASQRVQAARGGVAMTAVAPTLQAFFVSRLGRQRDASPHTVDSYRHTFRLLLAYADAQTGTRPSQLDLGDLDAELVSGFLDHLQDDRANSVASRNTRLAAVHSFFHFASYRHPEHAETIQQVLAIPRKKSQTIPRSFLTDTEMDAVASAPDPSTWCGRRDRVLLVVALRTGLRLSELTALRCRDVELGAGSHLKCLGKGRKRRDTPLDKTTVKLLRSWIVERRGADDDALFPSRRGGRLSPDAVQRLVAKHVATARTNCPSLANKHVTTHNLRHSCAMDLLRNGLDAAVLAMWLGHEKLESVNAYIHADLTLKQRALDRLTPLNPAHKAGRYKPPDQLLAFLEAL